MDHIPFAEAKIAGVNIGWYINTGQVAYMDGAVGIWQCGGDQVSFEFLHWLILVCWY